MKKYLTLTVCVVFLIITNLSPIYAQESNFTKSDKSIIFDDSYKKIICKFFEEPDKYSIYNLIGEDITDQFYINHLVLFKQNDLNPIMNEIYKNVQAFCEHIYDKDIPKSLRMGRTKSVSNKYTEIMRSNETSFSFAYEYIISGIFVYNTNTGKISSAYGAGFTAVTTDPAESWKCEAKDISVSSSISSNGYKAQFTATFKLYASSYVYLIPYATYYYGSHRQTLLAEGD